MPLKLLEGLFWVKQINAASGEAGDGQSALSLPIKVSLDSLGVLAVNVLGVQVCEFISLEPHMPAVSSYL